MAQKRKLNEDTTDNKPRKRRKLNAVCIENDQEDSDSDFDPSEITQKDTHPKRHRYQTRSTSLLLRKNIGKNNEDDVDEPEDDTKQNETKRQNQRRRGRPKSKRRKKKSNHIEKASSSNKKQEMKERLSSMDKYDTQQYISSVVRAISSSEYLHPFVSRPTSLPKRRIVKIMKLDPAQFKISSITLELMAILIEIFIRDLVSRSYKYTIKDNRKSLQLQDICRAVQSDNMYDFLIDIVPRIQSYDQNRNLYNFIYTSQMENNALTNTLGSNNDKNDEKEEKQENVESNAIRRSKRLQIRKSDKEEMSD